MSPRDVLDVVAPPREVPGLPIRDARGVKKILQKDLEGGLVLPRGGPHQSALCAMYRHYDGGLTDGAGAGYYAGLFVVWRAGSHTYRSGGVRILPFEAERIARALERVTGTRPRGEEPERVSGGPMATTSQLRAEVLDDSAVLLFVRFTGQGGKFYRSRGVEILDGERAAIAEGLRAFGRLRGRAK